MLTAPKLIKTTQHLGEGITESNFGNTKWNVDGTKSNFYDRKGYYKGYEPLLLTFGFVAGVSTKGDFAMTSIMKQVA